MKVLHSFYRSAQPSGENEAVLQQVELLAQGDFNVELIYLSADDLEFRSRAKLLTAFGLVTGTPTASPPLEWMSDADLIHVHNTFPAMSHAWLGSLDIPKVITAHNYRAFCANGLFLRDGRRCMDCTTHGSTRAIVHGCYRHSRVQSIPIAIQQRTSRSLVQLMAKCHRVLLPGEPMQDTFRRLGVTNTQVLHHPVAGGLATPNSSTRNDAWLFVGRASPEKGLADLLRLWPSNEMLVVVGDGPERDEAQRIALDRHLPVEFLGSLDGHSVKDLMFESRGLVFPSKALEGAPLVYGEAMHAGLPVLAAKGSTLATQTVADETGATFSFADPDSLMAALAFIRNERAELSNRAHLTYQERYTPEAWLDQIVAIYEDAISSHRQM